MGKPIMERILKAVVSAGITFVAGMALKRAWKLTTGSEPPNPEDPQVPAPKAIAWFIVSGVGVGLIQLLFHRSIARRQLSRPEPEPAHRQSTQNS